MIDLHVHSTFSDGTSTVGEIIEEAKALGLEQFAITDHNNLTGSIMANKISPTNTVVGVELSVGYKNNEELHLLGYYPNHDIYRQTEFILKTSEVQKRLAIAQMVERLNDMGYRITINELALFTDGTINRVHICRALMKHDYISSVNEGFEKLVGNHCPAYVERQYVTIEEACQAIHKDGGYAVLAHPFNYHDIKDIPKLLDDVVDIIDGIECIHPSANREQSSYLIDYAHTHNKFITGGSDYHGENKPNINLGMMNVPNEYKL